MPTTIVGILVAIVVAFGVMFAGGMDPIGIFFGDPMSAALVFVGTIAATFASMAMSDSIGGLKAGISTMVKSPKADLSGTIASIVEFADKARKEGVLALDKMIPEIEDEFLARGVQLVVDGTDPADTRDILELDVEAQMKQYSIASGFWTKASGFARARCVRHGGRSDRHAQEPLRPVGTRPSSRSGICDDLVGRVPRQFLISTNRVQNGSQRANRTFASRTAG